MQLDFVIERLKAQVPGLKAVGGAADAQAVRAGAIALPAAYVIPQADKTTPMDMTGRYAETDVIEFGVALVVSNLRDARGEHAIASLAPVRAAVRAALSGWVPDPATGEPMHKAGGELMGFDGNAQLWWMDRYRLTTYFYPEQP